MVNGELYYKRLFEPILFWFDPQSRERPWWSSLPIQKRGTLFCDESVGGKAYVGIDVHQAVSTSTNNTFN